MKKTGIGAAAIVLLLAAAYAAAPVWTAWSIRNAIRDGNTAYLESAIDWPAIKTTLKPSLTELALGPPGAGQGDGFWTRVKTYATERGADALVERYVTPEGLPLLLAYGKAYRERIKGQIDDTDSLPISERIRRGWVRLKRTAFTSPARFEFLVADKFKPERHYEGALELHGWRWKMTELRIRKISN